MSNRIVREDEEGMGRMRLNEEHIDDGIQWEFGWNVTDRDRKD